MIDNDLVRSRVVDLVNEAEHGRFNTRRYNAAAQAANYSLFLTYLGLPEQYADPTMAKGKIAWPETQVLHNHLRPFSRSKPIALPAGGVLDLKTIDPDVYWPTSMHRRLFVRVGDPEPECSCSYVETLGMYDVYTQDIDLVRPHHLPYRLGSSIKPVRKWPIFTIEGSPGDAHNVRVWPGTAIPVVHLEYLVRPTSPVWVAESTTELDGIEIYDPAASTPFFWDAVLIDTIANRVAASYARSVGNMGKFQVAEMKVRSGE